MTHYRILYGKRISSWPSCKACFPPNVSDIFYGGKKNDRLSAESSEVPVISPLLHSLCLSPSSPLNIADVTSTHLATILFAHLLSGSLRTKTAARSIKPSSNIPAQTPSQGQFFVPADGTPSAATSPEEDEEDAPQSLLHLFSENLSLCFLSRSRTEDEREEREWNRLIVGYICLLVQWLWDDPKAVREFLEAGGLGTVSLSRDTSSTYETFRNV